MFKTCTLLLLEILPIVIFFAIGQRVPFLTALGAYILATLFTIILILHISRRVSYLALIFGVVIIGAGSLSIWLDNPDILLIADTVYYLGAAILLFVLQKKQYHVLKTLFGNVFGITDIGWDILTNRWILALGLAGICNELVRQFGTTDDWLLFQLVRTFAILAFATYQFTVTKKYRLQDKTTPWGIRT